jgi:hypothetical protein
MNLFVVFQIRFQLFFFNIYINTTGNIHQQPQDTNIKENPNNWWIDENQEKGKTLLLGRWDMARQNQFQAQGSSERELATWIYGAWA